MKKYLLLIVVALVTFTAQAQRKVQGIVRNDLNTKAALTKETTPLDTVFSFDKIDFWVNDATLTDTINCNRAAMVISWNDSVSGNKIQPDYLVWGYRWPNDTKDSVRYGIDMIKAIAKADKRMILLIQYTGWMGYTINGIGYQRASSQQVRINFDLEGAQDNVNYVYPSDAATIAANAISNGQSTGIIEHPFGSDGTSYPAYDYDYWKKTTNSSGYHWLAGWIKGYWSYFTRDAQNEDWSYSDWGASSRALRDSTWDAWSYNADMSTMEGTKPGAPLQAATYSPRATVTKEAVQPTTKAASNAKAVYSPNSLHLENLKGYTGYINSIYGYSVSTFMINSDNETKPIDLSSGIYTFTGVKGNDKVSVKFVVK